jgi:hypothetical protein
MSFTSLSMQRLEHGRRVHGTRAGTQRRPRLPAAPAAPRRCQGHELGVEARDIVGREQGLEESAHALTWRPDRDALVAQLVELRERFVAAVEHPQRLVVERREHLDALALGRRHDASEHERDVDAGLRVAQQVDVLVGARRDALNHGHAVTRQDGLVTQRELVVQAVDGPRRHDNAAGLGTFKEPGDNHHRNHDREHSEGAAPKENATSGGQFVDHATSSLHSRNNAEVRLRSWCLPI